MIETDAVKNGLSSSCSNSQNQTNNQQSIIDEYDKAIRDQFEIKG
jgi:hypothetical protein